jgi:hypothetical protein
LGLQGLSILSNFTSAKYFIFHIGWISHFGRISVISQLYQYARASLNVEDEYLAEVMEKFT